MCGVYGMFGIPEKQTPDIISQLGVLNSQRGTDSTGLLLLNKKRYQLLKGTVNSYDFFSNKGVQKVLRTYNRFKFLSIIGHTRAATRGAVTNINAHPYINGNILFAHNGVINNFDDLQSTLKTSYEVDSQIIGHLLNRYSLDNATKQLQGFFAVPYINTDNKEMLNVLVHSAMFSFAYRNGILYYSSDYDHLKEALKGQKGFNFCKTGNDKQYSFYLVSNKIVISKKKIKAKENTYFYSGYSSGYSHAGYTWDNYGGYQKDNKGYTIYSVDKDKNKKEIIKANDWNKDNEEILQSDSTCPQCKTGYLFEDLGGYNSCSSCAYSTRFDNPIYNFGVEEDNNNNWKQYEAKNWLAKRVKYWRSGR